MFKRFSMFVSFCLIASSVMAGNQAVSPAKQVENLSKMCGESAEVFKQRQSEKSLFLRLGERKGVAKFVDNLYESHKANEKIGHLFRDVPKERFVTNVVEFVSVGTGGDGQYKGRDMVSAHKHLNISHADFLSAGGDVEAVMKSLGHGENEIQEMVCILVSMVPEVVTK